MSFKTPILLFLLCISVCCLAQSDQYSFSRVDVTQGLSHNQINTILKDKRGFVWFGTMSGLNRYDGYTVKPYLHHPQDTNSLIDNYINNIWECPDNKLWIETRNGVSLYNPSTEKFERNYNKYLQTLALPAGDIRQIANDNKGNYWFLYSNERLVKYTADKKTVIIRQETGASAAKSISAISCDSGGSLWLVYSNGVLEKISNDGNIIFKSEVLAQKAKGLFDYSLFIDASDELWIWTAVAKGAFHFLPATNSLQHFKEGDKSYRLNSNLVNGITEDNEGVIWIGTDHGGINMIDKKNQYKTGFLLNDPGDNKSLAQNSIYALYKDNAGIIWIGTYKQGVSYLNDNIVKFRHIKHQAAKPASLPYDDINHFAEDAKGNIWLGTNGGGLIYYDRKTQHFTQYLHNPNDPHSLSSNIIVSLFIDHAQKLWIGTYFGGLNVFDGKNFIRYKNNPADAGSLSDDRVWEIFEDNENNLWIGTLNGGLNLLDRQTGKFTRFMYRPGKANSIRSNYISSLLDDKNGNLWIGTAYGIDVLHKQSGTVTHYNEGQKLSNNNVISMLRDSKGRIWAGTREGLNVWNATAKTFRSFSTAHGLPNNIILTLLEDNSGDLWITTPNGLCQLTLNEKESIKNLTFQVRLFDAANNLQGMEFNENAALKLRSGELLFAGPYGFNIIQPASLTKGKSIAPVMAFTDFLLFNQSVETGTTINKRVLLPVTITEAAEIRLKHNENIFSIEFAALDFTHTTKGKYAYKLEGFNEDWLYTNSDIRRATYTNLDAGTYYFKLKALGNDGLWSKDEKVLKIVIQPSFWKSPLAIILYGLCVFGLLMLWRHFTLERATMRFQVIQQRKEAERMHSVDAMKTKFFTNVSHEFRTPLSLILSPLDRIIKNTADPEQKKQLHLVQRNARRLLNLVNQLLDFRKMEAQAFKLHPSLGDVVKFTEHACHSFSDIAEKKDIRLSFHSDVAVLDMYFDRDKLEKILFNLLSNAFKYTYEQGRVEVTVGYISEANKEMAAITVKDTGIGIPEREQERIFEPFFQNDVPEGMVSGGSGIGLSITKEFVKLHNGRIEVESELDKGTAFTVYLPVVKETAATAPEQQNTVIALEKELDEGVVAEELAIAANGNGKPTLLLVEDNEDFRFYLKDNLKQYYNIIEAANGLEGWQKIKAAPPHLVVTDMMMPHVSGLELAKKMKADPRTAGIPIILLTAMGSEEMQLEGYKAGVSDYVTKPFTFEILASRIKNLLHRQQEMQKGMQLRAATNPADVTVVDADSSFMQSVMQVIEKNMANADFTVEELSKALFLSRVAVYKKIVSLTGTPPLEFIRSVRLKRAAQLLSGSKMTVAEVAYEVGFNNPKSFARYFKEMYNLLPSQYAAAKKENLPQDLK